MLGEVTIIHTESNHSESEGKVSDENPECDEGGFRSSVNEGFIQRMQLVSNRRFCIIRKEIFR